MKKVIVLSHCIINPFCELDESLTKNLFAKTIKEIADRGIGILQLPCPELSYQHLERESITSQDERAEEYGKYCRELLKSTVQNIKEYHQNGIGLIRLVGIDTSPSCSTADSSSIMMQVLAEMLKDAGISIPAADMPHFFDGDESVFVDELLA
ncbi:MAG TPA: hypothetical protein PKA19_08865 [Bacillota bacterium]|nr:hypothetical protein [Bacillota bacterium]